LPIDATFPIGARGITTSCAYLIVVRSLEGLQLEKVMPVPAKRMTGVLPVAGIAVLF
jgi:hypothetical protein